MLLTKTVKIKWHNSIKKWYENKGYIFTNYGDEFEVKVEDLPDGCSSVYVDIMCDHIMCKNREIKTMTWQNYKNNINKYGKYYCKRCVTRFISRENYKKSRLKNSISFYDWCYNNLSKKEADEIMTRWDTELNGYSPKDVSFCSVGFNGKGYYFKCPRSLHKSELKRISDFVKCHKGTLDCKMCNSFAQYGYDNIDKDFLSKYWDWERNEELGIDPWMISFSANKKVWIKCQEKSYHDSYFISCNSFTSQNQRCPLCTSQHGKVHRFDSLGWLYPQVFYIWSKKNKKSPYEYSPMSGQYAWWKCLDGKHDDYYRKINTSNLCEFRCPECVQERKESIIQEKTRLYLEFLNYKVLHEQNCSLVPRNPKVSNKHGQLPFDNEIILTNGKHLICEVNGIQHYEVCGWHETQAKHNNTTLEQEFHYQRLKDRYKRFIAYKQGYEYLELPYWVFDKQDTYKKLIDEKINQILNNNIDTKVS